MLITTYETISIQPKHELKDLFRFLQVSCDTEIILECVEQNRFEKLSRGRKSGVADNSAFFRKGTVGDWKEEFEPSILNHMSTQGKKLMESLGYQLDN